MPESSRSDPSQLHVVRQLPSPLPPLPDQDVLSAEQWGILAAIADAVVPSLTSNPGNRLLQHPLRAELYRAASERVVRLAGIGDGEGALVAGYLGENATAQLDFRHNVSRLMGFYMDQKSKNGLIFVLNALNTRPGSLLLTGYATPLDCLPVNTREAIIQAWATSRLPLLRGIHRSLTTLVSVLWIRTSPTLGRVLGYPRSPVHGAPGTSFPFEFLQIPPPTTEQDPEVIETDVVVVGSGCGGAVAAKTLAEAGLKVLVVDKSHHWPAQHLPMSENDGNVHLFANGGAYQSDDSSIAVVNGSTWGGGGTVNWSASLQTQGLVRREWSQKFGLRHFESAQFQADLDAVCDRMGVGTAAIEHNKTNRVMLEGARKLGWSAKAVPQNTGGKAHNCGYCTLGCGSCGKKGPTETFLPDAAKAGATFLEGFTVSEILFADGNISPSETKEAIGVKGTWLSRDGDGGVAGSDRRAREVTVKASKVVLAAGPLSSPLILLRSGVQNAHIGRHLHLHPVSVLAAVWDEDVRPWEGSILTAVVNEFENLDGEGYGTKLEAMTMLPGFLLPLFPWHGGLQFKEFTAKMKRMTAYISLARDRYGGQVYSDPADGRCRIRYTPSKHDKNHILDGIVHLAEMVYVEGAKEIVTAIPGLPPFGRPVANPAHNVLLTDTAQPSINDVEFQDWIKKLRQVGLPSPDVGYASAHQMGTCRMGTDPSNSAVDEKGRVWGVDGLYICDTSVFPSASGVNPMITVMGIARGVARGIADQESGMRHLQSKI